MRLTVVANAVERGGAQEFLLEMLGLIKTTDLDVTVLTSDRAQPSFVSDLAKLDLRTYTAPYRAVVGYPDMAIERFSEVVKSSDLVWLADEVYLVARRVKRIRKDLPVIAHVHCYAMICPWWGAMYGLRETCTLRCSARRIIRCKQLFNERLGELGIIDIPRMRLFELLDFAKGPVDFARWPMKANVIERIDGFVAPSKYAKDLILTHLPQLEAVPFEVLDNPVVVPRISTRKITHGDAPKILYASGPSVTKGPHIALQAAKELLEEGFEISLCMLAVKNHIWIENLVRKLGLDGHVELLPRLDRNGVYEHMANSNLVLMPSIGPEPFGRVPVEANRLGIPAIVSERGALPEVVVDGITGLVAEPTSHAFAEAMRSALSRKWDRDSVIRAVNRRYGQKHIVDEFVRFLSRFV